MRLSRPLEPVEAALEPDVIEAVVRSGAISVVPVDLNVPAATLPLNIDSRSLVTC